MNGGWADTGGSGITSRRGQRWLRRYLAGLAWLLAVALILVLHFKNELSFEVPALVQGDTATATAPFAGVLTSVAVQPGDPVEGATPIALMRDASLAEQSAEAAWRLTALEAAAQPIVTVPGIVHLRTEDGHEAPVDHLLQTVLDHFGAVTRAAEAALAPDVSASEVMAELPALDASGAVREAYGNLLHRSYSAASDGSADTALRAASGMREQLGVDAPFFGRLEQELRSALIYPPRSGYIQTIAAAGASLERGDTVAEVISDAAPHLLAYVPAERAVDLQVGQSVKVILESAAGMAGEIIQIGQSVVDVPQLLRSQLGTTRGVEVRIAPRAAGGLLHGQEVRVGL